MSGASGQRRHAFVGARPCAGTTHLAISAAFAIADAFPGASVTCLLSNREELDALAALPGFDAPSRVLKGVRFGYLSDRLRWSDVPGDHVVADCGVLDPGCGSRLMELFWQGSDKYLVLGGGPWDAKGFLQTLGRVPAYEFTSWTWCFFGASREFVALVAEFLRRMGSRPGKRFYVPYDDMYLAPGRHMPDAYRMYLLGDANKKRKHRGRAGTEADAHDDRKDTR